MAESWRRSGGRCWLEKEETVVVGGGGGGGCQCMEWMVQLSATRKTCYWSRTVSCMLLLVVRGVERIVGDAER